MVSTALVLGIVVLAPTDVAQDFLEEARKRFAELEYEETIPLAETFLEHEGQPIADRMEGYRLLGSSLAIVGRLVEAEQAFRFLLRAQPDFEMSPDTPPKILRVFRSVKLEDQRMRAEAATMERARIIRDLRLEMTPIEASAGGSPILFVYRLRDPRGYVRAVNVRYRKLGEDAYSALALSQDESGRWVGEIPGEWTANDDGFELDYYAESLDDEGAPLLAMDPANVSVTAGRRTGPAVFEQPWFWVTVSAIAVGAAVGGAVWYDQATRVPAGNFGSAGVP